MTGVADGQQQVPAKVYPVEQDEQALEEFAVQAEQPVEQAYFKKIQFTIANVV